MSLPTLPPAEKEPFKIVSIIRQIVEYLNSNVGLALPFREQIAENRTYYVRSDGSDSNTGLSNTAGGAKLTIAGATDAAGAIDASVFDVTIRVQDGTWTENIVLPRMVGSGSYTLRSDSGTASACILTSSSGNTISVEPGAAWFLDLVEVRSSAGVNEGVNLNGIGSQLFLTQVDFGTCGRHQVNAEKGATVVFGGGNYTIRGDATLGAHIHCQRNSFLQSANIGTIKITGRRTFGAGFAQARSNGTLYAPQLLFAGDAVTYTVASPGVVNQTGHGGSNDDPVIFKGTPPAALTAGTIYFKRNVAANTYEVSATAGGGSINFADAGGASTAISIISGPRFAVDGNAQIITDGAGVTYFPGASAGTGDPGTYDGYT